MTTEALASDLRNATSPLFLTGAGISVASGIAPFRGTKDAVWEQDVLEMGTFRMFAKDPVKQWEWYLRRFDGCRGAQPNAAHYAITKLQEWKAADRLPKSTGPRDLSLRVVTQNIDGLHVAAGTQDVIEVHGRAREVRCSRPRCKNGAPNGTLPWDESMFTAFRAEPKQENLPRCPLCGLLLRPHVLWFDEVYVEHFGYRFDEATNLFQSSDLIVFVGTSFSVGITEQAMILATMDPSKKVWTIDPHSAPPEDAGRWLRAPSEEALPEVVRLLQR